MSIVSYPKKIILQEIRDNHFHGYVIAKNLKLPLSSIYEHLKELRQSGLITYSKQGRRKIYQLTEKGEMLLKAVE